MSTNTPTLAQLLNRVKASVGAETRVAIPGVVTSYDATKQLADVSPQVSEPFELEDGTVEQRRLPVVPSVPVMFPGASGFRITYPIEKGDTGLLIFCDRSIDAWLARGGHTAPTDARRHHLSDAVFVPGLHPSNAPWTGADANVITIGLDSAAADFVALASKVTTQLEALKEAFEDWTPVANDGGAALKTILTALFSTWPGDVASETVKVKG
jgi:hypothetical protein